MISPLPFAWECKAGSATLPFFGVQPVLLTDKGVEIQGPGEPGGDESSGVIVSTT